MLDGGVLTLILIKNNDKEKDTFYRLRRHPAVSE